MFFDDVSRMTGGRLTPLKRSSSSLAAFQSPRRLLAGSSSGSALDAQCATESLSVNVCGDIDALLSKAYDMSLQIPTTARRLSYTAGFLPPELRFNEVAAKDTLDLEAANIVHFQTSISHMRQSLCLFKASQDARCKPYEEQAQAYVKAMNDADLAAGAASSAAAAAGFPPVPDCAVVRPRSPVVADGSGLSHGDVRFLFCFFVLL